MEIARGWFQTFLFSALPGEMIQFDEYFSNGLKPPTILGLALEGKVQNPPVA